MNWSLIILGLVALASVTYASNSYLVIVPNLLKVGQDNQISVFIAEVSQPVEVKFNLIIGQQQLQTKVVCKSGQTCNATLTLPKEFPVGAGQLMITGTGGVTFEETRNVIVYDNRYVLLVQTCASSYRPREVIGIRVVATNEQLIPIENGQLTIEIYDATLKLVGSYPNVQINSGLTELIDYPIADHVNVGTWLVSATIGNTTSSVQVLVAQPVTPSFDLKAIFQRFLLRTDKTLSGVIEVDSDENVPLFGRAIIAVNQLTQQELEPKMQALPKPDEWRQWKSQQFEIAGRAEINYDLLSTFNVDVTKALAIQVYIQVTELTSGQERVIRHIIPIFNREVVYNIRPLEFQPGVQNEYEVIAKRPDGKPVKMENMIVTVRMMFGKGQKDNVMEIKNFYTHGRNDIGLFNVDIPENCIGVHMTITPLDESGQVRGYRTHPIPLMPTPRSQGSKLTIELLPSTVAPANTNVNVPVVSTQISTVGRTSNFYVQLIPPKTFTKFQPLPMSYVVMTNGRIVLTGEFVIQPTKECSTQTKRSTQPGEQMPPVCVFNGTLPLTITQSMIPYSTLLVYSFQPSLGVFVAESYRFSVAGLFQNPLTLNATIVPFQPTETVVDNFGYLKYFNVTPVQISSKYQEKTRVELSFTGLPDSTVGLNVFEYDSVLQGLSNEITKERVIQYLTAYEHVPLGNMPVMPTSSQSTMDRRSVDTLNNVQESESKEVHLRESSEEHSTEHKERTMSESDEENQIHREQMGYRFRYPVEKMVFGVNTPRQMTPVEGDDIYATSNMGQLYGEPQPRLTPAGHYRRKLHNSINQYDVTVENNDFVVATSMPYILTVDQPSMPPQHPMPPLKMSSHKKKSHGMPSMPHLHSHPHSQDEASKYGTPAWYEKVSKKLNDLSQEAFTFMHSGLSIVSDFDSLRMPMVVKQGKISELFKQFRTQSMITGNTFNVRDAARQLLEEYISQSDLSMVPPPIMLEEQARTGYYQSIFYNTSKIGPQGTGKVVLPRTKPFSTWLATGFALNPKSSLSIAQPIRLPTNQGLYLLANIPKQVQIGEHVLLTYGINNYLEKDLTNVVLRIRASPDFELWENTQSQQIVSTPGKDYTVTIPSMKSFAVETRNLVVVPKRVGVIQIVMEVTSEFGGDYEVLPIFVRESGIERRNVSVRLLDLTGDKKTYGPFVENIHQVPTLRSVRLMVSGTGLDRFAKVHTMETNALVGIDRALIRLYRSLGLRQYLNTTYQTNSPLYNMTFENITTAYQRLQLYNDYDGSYSFISDEGTKHSSLYLTTLAMGAMLSPMMPFRDNVTLNRTLNWILSQQNADGSFDDNGPCFHYQFCSGKFRRESLTAIVLYSLTRDNSSQYMPQFIYQRLFNGVNSPLARAQSYLISRVPDVLPDYLTISLFEMAFMQNQTISSTLLGKIRQALVSRKLTVVPEDGSKYIKLTGESASLDNELLLNSMAISLYASFEDYQTSSDIARWVVSQFQVHPYYDTVLDAVFRTQAWLTVDILFRKQIGIDKFAVTVDVTADNGQKQQFTINAKNLDVTQMMTFTLPVKQITYTVQGFGLICVSIIQKCAEPQAQVQPTPFKITQEFTPLAWFSEIKAKTCTTYTPTSQTKQFAVNNFNRTIVVEVELPSGTRVNLRQIGFFLSQVEQVMYYTYEPCGNKLIFFLNVPSTVFGQPICLEWAFERLSTVTTWAPSKIRVFDYLEQEIQLTQLVPIQFQPNLLGYSFVEAVHQARPSLEALAKGQMPKHV